MMAPGTSSVGEEDERREKQDRVEREVGREGEEKRGGNERACRGRPK